MASLTWKRKVEYTTGACTDNPSNPDSNGYLSVEADENPNGHNDPAGRITITDAERADGAYILYQSKKDALKLTGIVAAAGSSIAGLTVTDKDGNPVPAGGKGKIKIQDTSAAAEGDISYYLAGLYNGNPVQSCDPVIHNQEE